MYEDKQIRTVIEAKLSLLCYVGSQTICITKYYENDLLFLLPLSNDLWFIVLGAFSDSIKIFRLQKKFIRIMMGCRSSNSCRKLFSKLQISPLPSQYIFSLLLFVIRNRNQFLFSSEIYYIDTRQHANFYQPSVNLTKYQKGVYCLDVKVFNVLPFYIEIESDNPKKLKLILQKLLYENSFYSLDEYFEIKKR